MTSPRRSADFRPDPERGVYLTGDIDQSTLDRLTQSFFGFKIKTDPRSPSTSIAVAALSPTRNCYIAC